MPCGVLKPNVSGGQFCFADESLDNARRDGAASPEPVEDQMPMTPQALGDLLHRADPAAQGPGAQGIEGLHGPLGARVLPEPLEVLAEQMSPDAPEVCAHTTATLAVPDSLSRWIFSIAKGGAAWDEVWIGRSWPSGNFGWLGMSGRP